MNKLRLTNESVSLRRVAIAFGLVWVVLSAPAQAQCVFSPVYPNGCSVPYTPEWVRRGLDGIFLGACNLHDNCWAECNGEFPPYLGVGHKLWCDFAFLAHLEGACAFWAPQISYPLDDLLNIEDFLTVCNGIVAPVMYGAVSVAYPQYWDSQCCNGCNPDACATLGRWLPWSCGQWPGFGRSVCYLASGGGGGGGGWCGDGWCDPGEDCWSCSDCCGGGGGGGGDDGGGGGGGGCDPDGDGWVTEWECYYECSGWSDGEYCYLN